MPDYDFYVSEFCGGSIPFNEFEPYVRRAGAELERLERIYTVSGTQEQRKLAVCAMADSLYYFDNVANGLTVRSASIGSVSESSSATVDISQKEQSKQLYKAASLYLEICRGVGHCG